MNTISPEELQVIADLVAIQGTLSNAEFCKRYLKKSDGMWSQLRSNDEHGHPKYAAKVSDFGSVLADLRDDLERIREQQAFERDMGSVEYCLFDDFKAAINSVQACANEPKKRMVVYLAETNGGKTQLITHLVLKLKADRTHARESWRLSYKSALIDLLNDLRLMPMEFRRRKFRHTESRKLNPVCRTENELERALIAGLKERGPGILCIDEAHIFGARSINLLKTIINETPWRIMVAALPVLFERWMYSNWNEARQLLARCYAIVEAQPVDVTQVEWFLQGVNLNGDRKASAQLIADAANRFGLFQFVKDTSNRLRGPSHVALADVQLAIDTTAQLIARGVNNEPKRLALTTKPKH